MSVCADEDADGHVDGLALRLLRAARAGQLRVGVEDAAVHAGPPCVAAGAAAAGG